MNDIQLKRSSVSQCKTHHLDETGKALYRRRFDEVLPFHEPGLAPVRLNSKAWHVRDDGNSAYKHTYDKTFGYYCGLASVCKDGVWFHIDPSGQPAYDARYAFTGNYQNDICVVCDNDNHYFHINKQGQPLYSNKWRYCGDFREGYAVVQNEGGLSSHINTTGQLVHDHWFLDLDVFHKGHARARDSSGWYHINANAVAIYNQRYANIEPFYNGYARVETNAGGLYIIDERGNIHRTLREAKYGDFAVLSADMVGYWRTLTLSTAVELGVFDHLPSTAATLAYTISADKFLLTRLLKALGELGVIYEENGKWVLSLKGNLLCLNNPKSLAYAALEYGDDLLDRWKHLPAIIKGEKVRQDVFEAVVKDSERNRTHHMMLASYALNDYQPLLSIMNIQEDEVVFDAAGGSGTLSCLLADEYPKAHIFCGDMPGVAINNEIDDVEFINFDLFKTWPIQADKVILARVLHDWNDEQAIQILKQVKNCLLDKGELIVLEMLLPDIGYSGALCDLHLLAVTGGQERTHLEYISLFDQAGLELAYSITDVGLVSVLKARCKSV